jgi:hypothetical protein
MRLSSSIRGNGGPSKEKDLDYGEESDWRIEVLDAVAQWLVLDEGHALLSNFDSEVEQAGTVEETGDNVVFPRQRLQSGRRCLSTWRVGCRLLGLVTLELRCTTASPRVAKTVRKHVLAAEGTPPRAESVRQRQRQPCMQPNLIRI